MSYQEVIKRIDAIEEFIAQNPKLSVALKVKLGRARKQLLNSLPGLFLQFTAEA